jgi:dTDP-4-amino-4,6-dideoxygalactose transaminase
LSWLTGPFGFSYLVYPILKIMGHHKDKGINKALQVKPLDKKELEKFDVLFSPAQAKLAIEGLKKLDQANKKRIENTFVLDQGLSKIKQLSIFKSQGISLNYVIRVSDRKDLIDFLFDNGVDTSPGFVCNCAALQAYQRFRRNCPLSQKIQEEKIYLPNYHSLDKKDMVYITDLIRKYYEKNNSL